MKRGTANEDVKFRENIQQPTSHVKHPEGKPAKGDEDLKGLRVEEVQIEKPKGPVEG
jgi:hypothetical protein